MTSLLMGQQEDSMHLAYSSRDEFFNDDSGFQAFQLPPGSSVSSPPQSVNHEARNLCSDFKLAARTLVASFYKLFPADKSAAAATSELSTQYKKDVVSGLLNGDALWLNRVDKETVSFQLLNSIGISGLIQDCL
ncbi:hypothetical protein FIBSPDRAFT_955810 [Athelia psychrophila]|uniref:Uncharacterized protein n=1 Tax=Athelia psychrophila TaxID=1759441 RepID=A0A166HNS6_9AGAM|nr:hypothetical protein FIBSPDRAFT_955810 [Fibularhizoctonia sp. CBS 109695]